MSDSIESEKLRNRDSCSSCSVEYDLYILFLLSSDFESIDESCEYCDSSPVLIIVHDGDIELSLQSVFDLETSWCCDILEVDSTEAISDIFDRFYEFLDILRPDDDRECIDSSEFPKENTLPFHDWHRCLVSEVSESEDSRAIGDHSNRTRLQGIVIEFRRVFRYFSAWLCDSW